MLRLSLASDFEDVVVTARLAFSKRSWPYVMAMAVPWLLCNGQRSLTRLGALGRHRRSLSSYYRFLSDGKWRLEQLFASLFGLVVQSFALERITVVLDDTLCPKWGKGIYGTASYFDHARRPRPGYIWGHNWVVLALVVQVGEAGWVALPFWVALYRPADQCAPGTFLTRHQLAVQALWRVRCWFRGSILLLADGAYANDSLVGPLEAMQVQIVGRLRKDARLRELASGSAQRKRGRKPKYGPQFPKLETLAKQSARFHRERVGIYGKLVDLEVREMAAWWPALRRTIKVVITRDPKNSRRLAFLWTTDLTMSAVEMIESFSKRWTIEQLFSVAKNQLGFDSAEVRKERSVRRHAALCMALVTWTRVWVRRNRRADSEKTFSTMLSALPAETIAQTIFSSGPRSEGVRRIARDMVAVVTVVTQAA